jgi:hypothetical protein
MEERHVKVFVGFDSRRPSDYAGTVASIIKHCPQAEIVPLLLTHLRAMGTYTRLTTESNGVLFDEISGAPMSTEFAISRFLVPHLCGHEGRAIFVDGDFLFRDDISKLMALMPEGAAIAVVKHEQVTDSTTKMDGQPQVNYYRKNWSSLMIFDCEHPTATLLAPIFVNNATGRELHALAWLNDADIAALPEEWNWLEGYSDPKIVPKAVHYTRGTPDVIGYGIPYADEWHDVQERIQ